MKHFERFQVALGSRQPGHCLRKLAEQLATEGQTKEQIYLAFEGFLGEIRKEAAPREADEDAVLNVMDALTGWCHTDAAFLP